MEQELHPILQKLARADRRTIGRSNEVVRQVLAAPRYLRRFSMGY
jgi:hypothetical protein